MARRRYRLGRRGEMAAETRRRIVEATYALHGEQSIAATTMNQIAERADVSIGSVYNHFPTYDDVIHACGAYTGVVTRPPTPAIFAGARSQSERIERLAREMFAYYDRFPTLERVRAERAALPALDQALARAEAGFADLIRQALGPTARDARLVAFAGALLDPAVHGALTRGGLSTPQAAAEIAQAIRRRLAMRTTPPTSTPTRTEGSKVR